MSLLTVPCLTWRMAQTNRKKKSGWREGGSESSRFSLGGSPSNLAREQHEANTLGITVFRLGKFETDGIGLWWAIGNGSRHHVYGMIWNHALRLSMLNRLYLIGTRWPKNTGFTSLGLERKLNEHWINILVSIHLQGFIFPTETPWP